MRGALRFLAVIAASFFTYGALLLALIAAELAEGSGLGCDDTSCGPIAAWANDAYPWPLIGAVALAVAIGGTVLVITRRP